MNVEEIMIRLGVDARAVSTGLNQTSSYVKGWATSLVTDIAGKMGGIASVITAGIGFKKIEDRILSVKRAADSLGASTNFVQGIFSRASKAGLDPEVLSRPLIAFKTTIDAAKEGSISAREKLELWGVTTKNTNYHALRFEDTLGKLSERYLALGRNAAMLKDLGIRSTPGMLNLLGAGPETISQMSQPNYFRKITPTAIDAWSKLSLTLKTDAGIASTTVANLVGSTYSLVRHVSGVVGFSPEAVRRSLNTGGREKISTLLQNENKYISDNERKERDILEHKKEQDGYNAAELEFEKEGFTIEEKRTELLQQQRDLTESIDRLQASMQDRGKSSVEQLADRARKLMGLSRMPRGLDSVYTLTPAMATALHIQQLEDKASVASAYGDNMNRARFIGEADQLRKTNLFRYEDQDPTKQVVLHLKDANEKLEQINSNVDRLPQRVP